MNHTLVWGSLVVIILIIAGAVFFWQGAPQATAPTVSEVPTQLPPTGILEQEVPRTDDSSPGAAAPATTEITTGVATAEDVQITIDEQGFTPTEVTVSVGTTVTFVNNGQAAHWPASGPHPSHTALPGFDAKKSLATGETYSYTFTKIGSWSFHDHLNPRASGTVTVQ